MDKELYNDPEVSNAELVNRDTLERLRAKKRFKQIIRRINYILLSIVLCFVFVIVCMALFLKIETIEVIGNSRYKAEKIVDVSGISVGQNLYAINKKTAEKNIIAEYSYINDVVIRRKLPSTLTFRITEDEPRYYTEICGEYFVLSSMLRVLECTDDVPKIEGVYLIPVKLSEVESAIVGEQITFKKELTYDYITKFISGVNNHELADELTMIDLSKKYNIYVTYQDRFRIYLGDNSETEMKLTFAGLMIETFDPTQKGEIDAHDITVGSVILAN